MSFWSLYICIVALNFVLLMQVMSIKAVGIAIKLTLEGSSQAANFETWVFVMVSISCIIIQLNYLNKVRRFYLSFFSNEFYTIVNQPVVFLTLKRKGFLYPGIGHIQHSGCFSNLLCSVYNAHNPRKCHYV